MVIDKMHKYQILLFLINILQIKYLVKHLNIDKAQVNNKCLQNMLINV